MAATACGSHGCKLPANLAAATSSRGGASSGQRRPARPRRPAMAVTVAVDGRRSGGGLVRAAWLCARELQVHSEEEEERKRKRKNEKK